ncbi:MAG: class I SAM-dependent methyltransferase [Pseudonocardiaceae bacterium]|nr:MAG: class I SAM-dependent methyltransferase [Pseudonocardiaceae bacterium]
MIDAARRWHDLQSGRGIPREILAQAPASPWVHDPRDFAAPDKPADTPSRVSALGLLGGSGTVLDVGCGGGAAAFALVGALTAVTGVDHQPDMLEVFAEGARRRGIPYTTVEGRWPDIADAAGHADVVVSHHVLHNVVDLPPFVAALTAAARSGVVVEMLDEHPMAWLDPLWLRFHGLRRPEPARTDDAVAVLLDLGIAPDVARWERESPPRQDAEWVTRRLCLPTERIDEVGDALAALPERPRHAATLTWQV